MSNKIIHASFFFLCLNFSFLFAQNQTMVPAKEAIALAFENYFETERENIHVQFDKNVFLTNEDIWFKGYVYNKKRNLPFYETTNVYVQLIDENGNIVANQLLYAISGFFSGKIDLNKKMPSGYYYLQFYTNWMNNFSEDESYIKRVKIKSKSDDSIPLLDGINPQKINVELYPEGGNFISNVPNTVGVKITDINGKPIPGCTLEIYDSNDKPQKSVPINAFGMGKFEFTPEGQQYKAVASYNNRQFVRELPVSSSDGIALEVNNYIFENKTMVRIRCNKEYLKTLRSKELYLVIQKNEKSNIVDIKPDGNTAEFFFSNALLFKGVNSIRIIDSEMTELAHRLVFCAEEKTSRMSMNPSFRNEERIDLSGNSNWNDACLSVSVLPMNTKVEADDNIVANLTLNAYLNEKISVKSDYFNQLSRQKKYDLDLMLLSQKSNKYDWGSIRIKPASPVFPFEKGLDVKGTITKTDADLKKCRVQLKNLMMDVISSTETIDNNEFIFKNTNVTDSLSVICSLIDRKDLTKHEMEYYLTVINKDKKFNKTYIPTPYTYPGGKETNAVSDIESLRFDSETILLEEVKVVKEKPKLKRQNQPGNGYLRGYKVGVDVSENMDVLSFIEQNGFNVSRDMGTVNITGRGKSSLNGAPSTPLVFLDSWQLMDFDELLLLRMFELEEIYISSTALVPSMFNNLGIIKIYRKQPTGVITDPKNKPKPIIGGFEVIMPFENADYKSENTTGFENFGLIHWAPWNLTDNNGNFKISLPNKNHKTVKVFIEGFTMDGQLISEIREINLAE